MRAISERRQCTGCGHIFWVDETDERRLCMECVIAEKDRRRVEEGPTVRHPKPVSLIAGPEILGNPRRRGTYDERLAEGFAAMGGQDL